MARTHSRGAHAARPAPLAGGRTGPARGARGRGARAGEAIGADRPGEAVSAGRPGEPVSAGEAGGAGRPVSAGGAGRPGRAGKKRAEESRVHGGRPRSTRVRVIAASCATAVLLLGVALGWASPDPSAAPTVQAFLLDWENGWYAAAAAKTTGAPAEVAAALQGAYRQLGAADISISMGHIAQRGDTAHAYFDASVDLGRGGQPWDYQGSFSLRRVGGDWKVVWSPSVIAPGLRPGLRLAVLDTMPPRAQLLDAEGRPLSPPSLVYTVGVYPGRLRNPARTVDGLAAATGLTASQVLSWVNEAPATQFLELLRLSPASYQRLGGRLRRVPQLVIKPQRMRLLKSISWPVSGSLGTEAAGRLQQMGIPYRPGATVGLSGLQQAYQRLLIGTPTTEVVEETPSGQVVTVLKQWPGQAGTPVRTTIDSKIQIAANHAMRSLRTAAAIVAVSTTTGRILAVAQHEVAGMPAVDGLAGRYQPGQAFTIVSTAALLETGFDENARIPCGASNLVGGQSFVNVPPVRSLGTFRTDFAQACATAFAQLSLSLAPKDLLEAASGFGLGKPWQLQLGAFTGSLQPPSGQAQMAEDAIGTGGVEVSPLDMAIAAEVVQSGTWRPPMLVTSPPDPGLTPTVPFGLQVVSALRGLMKSTVTSGAGRAADVAGAQVFGQVGSAPLGTGGRGLRTDWFVGYQGTVAFAVLELSRSIHTSAAPLAGQFLRDLSAGF
jgi:cell division protein FtsI/penicillin-binding protein 2